MAGLLEFEALGRLGLILGGWVALCVALWLWGRWLRRAASGGIARRGAVEAIAEGVATESVVLFKAYPGEPPFVVADDVRPPVQQAQVVAPPVPAAPVQAGRPVQVNAVAPLVTAAIAVELSVEPVVAAPVRRRPRPAWELAVDGQTPGSLLARAHEHLAAGNHDEAAVQLRACARLASKLKEVAVEAVARLELGDLAQLHGDMTTACEHWQLARSLYGELKREDEVKASVKRMETAGCPTDWVLTKF